MRKEKRLIRLPILGALALIFALGITVTIFASEATNNDDPIVSVSLTENVIESVNATLGQAQQALENFLEEVAPYDLPDETSLAQFILTFVSYLKQANEILLANGEVSIPIWDGQLESWDIWNADYLTPWYTNWINRIDEVMQANQPQSRFADDDRRNGSGDGWFFVGRTRHWFYYLNWNRQYNWIQVGNSWFFLNPPLFRPGHQPGTTRGTMLTGWRRVPISNNNNTDTMDWFFFNPSGVMQTRWQQIPISNSSNTRDWFYFGSNGRMRVGRHSIWWSNSNHAISCMVFNNEGRWNANLSTQGQRCN